MAMFRLCVVAALLCASEAFKAHSSHQADAVSTVDVSASPPMFTKETMPDVSPTLKCVINLTLQYFVIYTALFIVKTVNNLRDTKMTGLQTMLETACTTASRLC